MFVPRIGLRNVPPRYVRRTVLALVVLTAFSLIASLPALSQGIVTGSLSGTVVDPSTAVIVGADVTAIHTGTNQVLTTTTNNVGYWALRAVPVGTYKVIIEAPGFRNVEVTADVVVSKETSLGTSNLALARESQVVDVRDVAPLIENATSQITTNFVSQVVGELPLSGGIDALTLFIPGVADTGENSFSNNNGASFTSNGLRGRSNNFQIDGQANNDNLGGGPSIFMTNQDAISEVTVITNNFGVEYGRNSGSIVNYVTKSGSNTLHGSLFEYNQNSLFDSHTNAEKSSVFGFCPPGIAINTPIGADGKPNVSGRPCIAVEHPSKFIDNRYGGTLGGPIVRNKAWFFGSYLEEKTRQAGAPSTSGSNITPTPLGLTQLAAAFPGNPAVMALQTIGPYAVTCAGMCIPRIGGNTRTVTVSNGVTATGVQFAPVARNVPSVFNDWEATGKADMQLTKRDRLTARYIFQKVLTTGALGRFAAGAWVDIPAKDQQIALDWVRTFTNVFFNQARFSYSRAAIGFESGSFPDCTRTGLFNCPTSIGSGAGASWSGNVAFGMQNNLPQARLINNSQWQDNASWVRGRHTFKFGGEYDRQRSPNVFPIANNGVYQFNGGGFDDGTCAAEFPLLTAVNSQTCSFSRFLKNEVRSLQLTDGPPSFNFKEQDLALYAGDDWRIKDNLTLNLGIRWEFATQPINLLAAITRANQAASPPFWDPTLPASLTTLPNLPNHYNYWAPNFGFAWMPKGRMFGDGKTVIRGGARIAYDPAFYNMFLNVATFAPVVNAGIMSAATCTSPCLPATGLLGSDIRAVHLSDIPRGGNPGLANRTIVSPDFHEPRTYLWSLGIEREIASKVVFETRYVGNRVNGNFQTINANPELAGLEANFASFIPSGVTPCATASAPGFGRKDCDFTNVRERINGAWSYYHGWQNQLRISGWHGVTAGAGYTWSKTIDNNSEIFSTFGGGTSVAGAQNPFDTSRGEKAESGISFPNTASVYLAYDLPFYKSQKGFLGHLLGGLGLNTTWRYSSGQLWTPLQFIGVNGACQDSFDNAFFSSVSTCRPFYGNPGAPLDTVGQCINAAAADCGLVNYYTGAPTTKSAVHWIYNNDAAAAFFGTPYGNVRRNPGIRGQTVSAVNLSAYKRIKIAEHVDMRVEAQVYNLFNRQFLGVPDSFIDDINFANGGSFANTRFNDNGGVNAGSGGSYTNAVNQGLGRRRMSMGLKLTF